MPTADIRLEYYRTFYYVAKLKSISKASEALHVSQPAVSHEIKLLEDLLGSKLFYRKTRGVELTDAGNVLLPYVTAMLHQIEAGETRMRKLVNLEEGDLYIGTIGTAYHLFLLSCLKKYSETYPNVRIHIRGHSSEMITNAVLNGSLDVGIIMASSIRDEGKLDMIPLATLRYIFVAGPRFSHLKEKTLSLDEILSNPIICLQKGTTGRKTIDEWMKSRNVVFKPAVSLPTPMEVLMLAKNDLGIGMVLDGIAKEELARGELHEIHCEELMPTHQLFAITAKEFQNSTPCEKFLKMLKTFV